MTTDTLSHSFAAARSLTLASSNDLPIRKTAAAYDPDLQFQRIIDQKPNDPSSAIYSIDTDAILKLLEVDELDKLFQITLAARPTRNGVAIWDVLFNDGPKKSLTSCFLTAQSDYSPIPQNRVIITTNFLNFSAPVSRVHYGNVVENDRVGIAIHDLSTDTTYLLLYTIMGNCLVPTGFRDDDNRSGLISAINLMMDHAIKITRGEDAVIVEMQEDKELDVDLATPFIHHLQRTVYDISNGYSWKPHFLPISYGKIDRPELEARLQVDISNAKAITYNEFENLCRKFYRIAKGRQTFGNKRSSTQRVRPGARDQGARNAPKTSNVTPPVLEVVSINDKFWVKFDHIDDPSGQTYVFSKEDIGGKEVAETYLSNKDLASINVEESSKVVVLTPSLFEDNAFLRYFSMNF